MAAQSTVRICAASLLAIALSACSGLPAPSAGANDAPSVQGFAGDYLVGRAAQVRSDHQTAADRLGSALATTPDNRELRRETFDALISTGRLSEAAALARAMIANAAPGTNVTPFAALTLMIEEVRRGDYARAQSHIEGLSERGLGLFMVALSNGWLSAGRGDMDAARASLMPLIENRGLERFGQYHLGLVERLSGNLETAEAALDKAYGDPGTASMRVVEQLGFLYEATGRNTRAELLYSAYFDRHQQSLQMPYHLARLADGRSAAREIITVENGLAEAMLDLSALLAGQDAPGPALVLARFAEALRPNDPVIILLIGEILEATGRHRDAITTYRAMPADAPQSWDARVRAAAGLRRIGDSESAIELLAALAAERPSRADVLIDLGAALHSLERFEEAAVAYDDAVARLGGPDRVSWQLLYRRGIAYERSKQWPKAEADFLRALEQEPDQPSVLNYLGYSWVDQGVNLERARGMIERAVELRPESGYIVDSLGWVLYKLGDFEGAVEQLERAVELRAQDPTINDHLGDAYWRVGREHEARFQWRRVLSLEPDETTEESVRRKLVDGLPVEETADATE